MANCNRSNPVSEWDEFAAPAPSSANFAEELEAAFDAVLMADTPQPGSAPCSGGEAFSTDEHRHDAEAASDQPDQLTASSRPDHTYPPPSNLDQPANMDAPLQGAPDDRESECIRVRDPNEEHDGAYSHSTERARHIGSVDWRAGHHQAARKPGGRGRLSRNVAIAATVLNGLVVASVISAMLVPDSPPTANGGDGSAGNALAAGSAQDQPVATMASSQRSAAMIEDVLPATEEPNDSSAPTAAAIGATLIPPIDNASAASAAHRGTTSSSILQKRSPTDQSPLPDAEYPDHLVEAPALAAAERRPAPQARDASNRSTQTRVRLIQPGGAAVAALSTSPIEPDIPGRAATEPSGASELTSGFDPQSADARPDGPVETGGAGVDGFGDQPTAEEITAHIEPDIVAAGAEVTPEVTRIAPVTATVNMRTGPDLDATIITVLSAGSEVGVIGCDTWCEVVVAGERGWIYQSFVSDASLNGDSDAVASSGAVDSSASGGAGTNGDLGRGITPDMGADLQIIPTGTPLISADGAPIGMVRDFHTDTNGQRFVVVALPDDLGTAVGSIRLRVEHVLAADQHARLNFTRAQFLNALPQSGAEASARIDAN